MHTPRVHGRRASIGIDAAAAFFFFSRRWCSLNPLMYLLVYRFLEKRNNRVWTKKVKYDVRKNFADSRLRVKGRFVKKEDEELLRELLKIT